MRTVLLPASVVFCHKLLPACAAAACAQCPPSNKELLECAPLVLCHQQHSGVQLVSALAQQLANGVTVSTAARHLNLVGNLGAQTAGRHKHSTQASALQHSAHALCSAPIRGNCHHTKCAPVSVSGPPRTCLIRRLPLLQSVSLRWPDHTCAVAAYAACMLGAACLHTAPESYKKPTAPLFPVAHVAVAQPTLTCS